MVALTPRRWLARSRFRLPVAAAASLSIVLAVALQSAGAGPADSATKAPRASTTPIRHIVIIDQENRSFDHVLGKLCVEVASGAIRRAGANARCDGAAMGALPTGTRIPLRSAPDSTRPDVDHTVRGQQVAIDGGRMDGFAKNRGCTSSTTPPYGCMVQFDPLAGPCRTATGSCIPNLAKLAETFVISDRTFEFRATPSWAGHMVLATPTTDGFLGFNPRPRPWSPPPPHPGWGCDSGRDSQWSNRSTWMPSCIPDRFGRGPYRASRVPYVPTIFDRLDAAGLSWKIYGKTTDTTNSVGQYGRSICPTFYECLSTQRSHLVSSGSLTTDASAGRLPAVSWAIPTATDAQHPPNSMVVGDAWIGRVVSAIENGPDWASTAIFITWDDCGCFYDHVNPLVYDRSWGVRVPMVIVSPYAKAGFTDSTPATFVSLLAFIEHTFALHPLMAADSSAYDYSGSFNYSQAPLSPVRLATTARIPAREARYIRTHPDRVDDPT